MSDSNGSNGFDSKILSLLGEFDAKMNVELALLGRVGEHEIAALGGVVAEHLIRQDDGMPPLSWVERLGALIIRSYEQDGEKRYIAETVLGGTKVQRADGSRLIYLDDHGGKLPAGMLEYGKGHVLFHQFDPPAVVPLVPAEPSEALAEVGLGAARYNPPAPTS